MDRIELAERQYTRIAPKPGAQWPDISVRKILVWLKDYVCPLVEEYINDVPFRSHAFWSLDVLTRASLSSVASLVGNVDRSLVTAAAALLTVVENRAIGKSIRSQNPPRKRIVKETVRISAEGTQRLDALWEEVDDLPFKHAQVQRIAEHRYADLVCRDDFFGPVGGLVPRKSWRTSASRQ